MTHDETAQSGSGALSTDQSEFPVAGATGNSERVGHYREAIREFKICDATVTKTSFKIATSSQLIFFVIVSACLTSKNYCNFPGTELGGALLKLRQEIQIRRLVFTFSEKLENW